MELAKKTGWLQPLLIKRMAGFTLIEIIVAIALIAIGILGFSLNTIGIIQGNFISGNYTIATSLAQDKMEELLDSEIALPTCPTASTAGCFDGPLNSQGTTDPPGAIYNRSWVVTVGAPESGLSTIVVTVNWQDSLNRQVEVTTLVYTG